MSGHEPTDVHLQAVFDELVSATNVTKQMVWASPPERRDQLQELLTFLVEQTRLVDEAEARLGGRGAAMAAPSSHERRNRLGEADSDVYEALDAFVVRAAALASDIRRRAVAIGAGDEAELLVDLADGLEQRADALAREA